MKVKFTGKHRGIVHYNAGGAKHIFGDVAGYREKEVPERQAKALVSKYPGSFTLEATPAPAVPKKKKVVNQKDGGE